MGGSAGRVLCLSLSLSVSVSLASFLSSLSLSLCLSLSVLAQRLKIRAQSWRAGGANIRALIEEFSLSNIDIQEAGAEGIVTISSKSAEANAACEDKVRFMVQEAANFSPSVGGTKTNKRVPDPEVGKVYEDCR